MLSVTYDNNETSVVTEIKASSTNIHIERMDDGYYWACIDSEVFEISTKKKGRCIITKSEKITEAQVLDKSVAHNTKLLLQALDFRDTCLLQDDLRKLMYASDMVTKCTNKLKALLGD